ncbi:MAG: hypothetical protein GX555_10800 [Actinomycetales bacterium]|nr:hypothetical protein [Actinomycetales bacterium]
MTDTRGGYPTGIVVDDSACDPHDLSPCGGVAVTVVGDVVWDVLVGAAVRSGWPGLEALAGVGRTVSEVIRTNPASHGQTVSDVVATVRTWDRRLDAQRTFPWSDCDFTPGGSRFAELLPDGSQRYEILDASLLFKQGDLTAPVTDPALVRSLGIAPGDRVPLAAVHDVVAD